MYFCCLITSKFAPEDVIAWCQDEWRAAALQGVLAGEGVAMTKRLHRQILSYLHPDRAAGLKGIIWLDRAVLTSKP